jgi:hypothetical protein
MDPIGTDSGRSVSKGMVGSVLSVPEEREFWDNSPMFTTSNPSSNTIRDAWQTALPIW